MKQLFFIVIACHLLIYEQIQSVPTKCLEGFDAIVMPEYEFLNPVYGQILAVKQDLIENFILSGQKNHPLTRLCNQLFFKREDDGSFAPTKKAEYIATYLTPYDIGWLIALVLFKPDIFSDASEYSHCATSKKADQDICNFLKKIKDRQTEKDIKTPFKPSAIFKFINTIIEARKKAQEQLYDDKIPIHILLALACMKSTSKIDVFDVMRGIFEHSAPDKSIFIKDREVLFKQESSKEKELFLNTLYEEKNALADFKNFEKELSKKNLSQHNFLLQLLTLFSFEMVQTLSIHGFSDCTEAGLVEFVRCLLYKEGLLDILVLPENIQKNSFIVNFVDHFKGKSVNDEVARTWFFDELSNKKSMFVYSNENQSSELKAIPANILQGLNFIFGTNAKEWKELGPALSTEKRTIMFELKDSPEVTKGTIVLSVKEDGNEVTDELIVAPGHTEVTRAINTTELLKIEETIKTFFGNEKMNTYPFCIFKDRRAIFESVGQQNQINTLLTHALRKKGFGLFCMLLIDPSMESKVQALFDKNRVIPSIDSLYGNAIEKFFQNYQQVPFSAYAARFPSNVLKEAFLGDNYHQNVLNFLQFLQEKKTLESVAEDVIDVLMDRYGSRLIITRFQNGAIEKLLMDIAVKYPELFSQTVHKELWARGDLYKIEKYLIFEKFLVKQNAGFFSKDKKETLHEFILMQEPKKPFLETELINMVCVYGEAVVFENKALFPTISQEKIETFYHRFDTLAADQAAKDLLVNLRMRVGEIERMASFIFVLLCIERFARQKNPQFTKEPHLLKKSNKYFSSYSVFLEVLVMYEKKYPHELWSIMVDEKQTFAELFANLPSFLINYEQFAKKGFIVPDIIKEARLKPTEARAALLVSYRPSLEKFIDFVYALSFI